MVLPMCLPAFFVTLNVYRQLDDISLYWLKPFVMLTVFQLWPQEAGTLALDPPE